MCVSGIVRLTMTAAERFGSRTTSEEAIAGVSLAGKTAIVTGASSGLGVETARVLALAGADVVLACRSVPAGEAVASSLRAKGTGSLRVEALDLADLDSVRAFADRFVAQKNPLHLLINNAGIMASPLGKTAQGHELQVGTNHLGHFLLTRLLTPSLAEAPAARVVTLSSSLHKRGDAARLFETLEDDPGFARRRYVPFDAYADSKLANVLFTRQLARELPASVLALSLHPGVIPTNLTRSMGTIGSIFRAVGGAFTKSVAQGAATTIVAATSPALAGQSGAYLSDCTVRRPSRAAQDDASAARLWSISERLVARA